MHFIVNEDTPPHVVEQVLNIRHNTGRMDYVKIVACEWKGKECTTSHLLRDCPVFKKKEPKDRMRHLQVLDRCFNCMKKGHRSRQFTSIVRCIKYKARHNIALHDAWLEKETAVALLTKMVSPVALLTTPIIVSNNNSPLQFETNTIHDYGATVSICSKELADAIALVGEERPLGLSVFGNPNQVQQSFNATVQIADAQGVHVGNAVVNVVPEFVNMKAMDWSKLAKDFPHLRALNFPTPFREGECHMLLGNDNHHLLHAKDKIITALDNPQAYPYAALTPLGWYAAGPTLPPIAGDPFFNIVADNFVAKQNALYKTQLSSIQKYVGKTE
jgi:hypothetical protein